MNRNRISKKRRVIRLGMGDSRKLAKALLAPTKPNRRLGAAARRYLTIVSS
jgi:uncharacterized protein (DUF1778 family)